MPANLDIEHDEPVVLFLLNDSEDQTVDAWAAAFRQTIDTTHDDDHFYILVDVSAPGVVFTPRAREQTAVMFKDYSHRKGFVAFIFEWETGPHIARMFFAAIGPLAFELKPFSDRAEAVQWLKQQADSV